MEKIDWFVTLLVFNFIVITLTGFYGGYLNDEAVEISESDIGSGLGSVNFDLVTGFEGSPTWINSLFALQLVILIYLGFATIFPGG